MKTYMAYFDDKGQLYCQPMQARTQNDAVTGARRFARDNGMKYLYIRRA